MLKNQIRKTIIETKEKKEIVLIEQKMVKNRIMMIVESKDNINNFKSLSKEKQLKISFKLMQEFHFLNENQLLNEGLGDILSSLFGNSLSSLTQTLAEPLVDSILKGIGLGGYFEKFLLSFITTNPSRIFAAFKDCKSLTGLVAEALSEAMVMKIQQDKGAGGHGYDFLRNLLGGAIKDISFVKKIEEGIENTVCGLFGKYSNNAENALDKLKPAVANGLSSAKAAVDNGLSSAKGAVAAAVS